jgi:hypothetical protein
LRYIHLISLTSLDWTASHSLCSSRLRYPDTKNTECWVHNNATTHYVNSRKQYAQ